MKKNGFTLIELLAVIVILAIIVLISTPTILEIIEKSKLNAAEISAQNYADALEQQMVANEINGGVSLEDGNYSVQYLNSNLNIVMEGDQPDDGTVIISNQKVKGFSFTFNDISVQKSALDGKISTTKETNKSYKSYKAGDIVTITNQKWYVIKDSDSKTSEVRVMLSSNIDNKTYPYDQAETCKLGNTSNCQKIYHNATIKNQIVEYINSLNVNGVNENDLEYDGLIDLEELENLGCSVVNNENSNPNYDCTSAPSWLKNSNYWINSVYAMDGSNSIVSSDTTEYNDTTYGIRPVITINKDNIGNSKNYDIYKIGDIVTIANQKWYVIKDSDSKTSEVRVMLSSNIDNKTYPYDQAETCKLGNTSNCQKIYHNATIKNQIVEYINSLNVNGVNENDLEYDGLIDLEELENLGCSVVNNENSNPNYDCTSAPSWLKNSNYWINSVYAMDGSNSIVSSDTTEYNDTTYGIRPVITINKNNVTKKY